jgi:lipid II:glycine glycyltransferase (peptidoglycan interpeptide bridge formation enzyme)
MNYYLFDLNNKKEWSEYLNKLTINERDVYFSPDYYEVYENNGDGKALCYVFEDGNNLALYPFLINSVNRLGYELDSEYYDIQGAYGYNGVVSNNRNPEFIKNFYSYFNSYCSKANIIAEFTRFHPLLSNYCFSLSYLETEINRHTVYIDLENSIEQINMDFSSACRGSIRKAQKMNIRVSIFSNRDKMKLNEFMQLYYLAMDRVQSNNYFYFNNEYFNNLMNMPSVVQFCCYFDNVIIASALCFYSPYFFHGHLSATLRDYFFLNPNNFMIFENIKYAKSIGCKYFHMGGGNSLSATDALFKFKTSFSKTTANFYIGKKIHNPEIYYKVIRMWESKFPEKKQKYQNMILKYRS